MFKFQVGSSLGSRVGFGFKSGQVSSWVQELNFGVSSLVLAGFGRSDFGLIEFG